MRSIISSALTSSVSVTRRHMFTCIGSTRIVAAAMFSRIWVPIANTGRANVSAIEPMDVPDDLRSLLENRDA